MSDTATHIVKWFGERHKWLQDAARRLLRNGEVTEADVEELLVLCKREAGIEVQGHAILEAQAVGNDAFQAGQKTATLWLKSIGDVHGINALAPREPLTFQNEPLTIVYGINGAGKSGYTRILKHCCGARGQGALHRNVFETVKSEQKCKIEYALNGVDKELEWTPTLGVHGDLQHICLYDTDAAGVYVNSENEVTYEPPLLTCFRVLVEVCEKINGMLDSEVKAKSSKKPVLPSEHALTNAGNWYEKINSKTTAQEVDDKCTWSEDDKKQLDTVLERLKEENPAERSKALRKTKGHVTALKQLFVKGEVSLGLEAFAALVTAKNSFAASRQAADVDAKKVFEGLPVDGVASESWKLLWEQARQYSESEAYPSELFPNVNDSASCVLCQQPLTDEAKARLHTFEMFVKGGLEAEAKKAEEALQKVIDGIEALLFEDKIDDKLDLCELKDQSQRDSIKTFAASLTKRKKSFLSSASDGDLVNLPTREAIEFLTSHEDSLENSAKAFDEDAKTDKRPEHQKTAKELRCKKWVSEQKNAVEAEILRLREVGLLQKAQGLTNTNALSLKKSTLAEELITKAFAERFEKELEHLGASRVRVAIEKTRSPKGQVLHQLKIKKGQSDVRAVDVLSEGEFRIVSVASFLADVDVNGSSTPFIFDDPISSLDQDFEEATAARLIKLCSKRQVIVFTHRLSLLAMLEDAADKANIGLRIVSLQRESWGTGQPSGPPLPAQKPKTALNELSNARLAKAKKVWAEEGSAAYAVQAKALCSDIRITLERLIELELLADVIQRFRRPINTMGKIEKLAKILPTDCEFIDAMMTKYSRYEHAQPREAPVQLPEPDEIEQDLLKLKSWQAEFSTRAIPST